MAVAALAFALLAYFYYEYVEEGAYDEFEANVSSGKKNQVANFEDPEEKQEQEEETESKEEDNGETESKNDDATDFWISFVLLD